MQNRKRDTDVQNRLLDSVGESEGGMFRENSIETSIFACTVSYKALFLSVFLLLLFSFTKWFFNFFLIIFWVPHTDFWVFSILIYDVLSKLELKKKKNKIIFFVFFSFQHCLLFIVKHIITDEWECLYLWRSC